MAKKPAARSSEAAIAKAAALERPSSYSFLRSVEPTEFSMHAIVPRTVKDKPFRGVESIALQEGNFEQHPVLVTSTVVRGTITHSDPAKTPAQRVGTSEKALNSPNIAHIEEARLHSDAELLLVSGEVRFQCHARKPQACDQMAFGTAVTAWYDAYANRGGTRELALRFVLRALSGAWMWRNCHGNDLQVAVRYEGKAIVIGEDELDLGQGFTLEAVAGGAKRAQVEALVEALSRVLAGATGAEKLTLQLLGLVRMGKGATVYPSQELSSEATEEAQDRDKSRKNDLGRILSKNRNTRGEPVATIHARKVGNALRTIDTWHGVPGVHAIAVEPFGANTHQSVAYRVNGNNLYTLLGDPQALSARLEAEPEVADDHHFVAACLLRGGVYGFGKRNKQKGGDSAGPTDEAVAAEAE